MFERRMYWHAPCQDPVFLGETTPVVAKGREEGRRGLPCCVCSSTGNCAYEDATIRAKPLEDRESSTVKD